MERVCGKSFIVASSVLPMVVQMRSFLSKNLKNKSIYCKV